MLLKTNRSFFLLWQGQLVSQFGNKIYLMALAWYFVSDLNDNLGLVKMMLSGSLPLLILGPFAGPFVDRLNKRNILICADMASGVIVLGLAAVIHFQLDPLFLYAGVFLLSLCLVFFNPAARALIPCLVRKEEIQEATSLYMTVAQLAQLVGAAIGGALVGAIGVFWAVALDGFCYVVSASLECFLPSQPKQAGAQGAYFKDLVDGFVYVKRQTVIFRLLLVSSALNLFLVPILVYLPILISDELKMGAGAYGMAEACWPIGALMAAAFLVARKITNHVAWIKVAMLVLGACFLTIYAGKTFPFVLGAMIVFGFMVEMVNINGVTFFTKSVDPAQHGRFFNLMEIMAFGSFPLAYLMTGELLKRFDAYDLLLYNGCAVIALAAAGFLWIRQERSEDAVVSPASCRREGA